MSEVENMLLKARYFLKSNLIKMEIENGNMYFDVGMLNKPNRGHLVTIKEDGRYLCTCKNGSFFMGTNKPCAGVMAVFGFLLKEKLKM